MECMATRFLIIYGLLGSINYVIHGNCLSNTLALDKNLTVINIQNNGSNLWGFIRVLVSVVFIRWKSNYDVPVTTTKVLYLGREDVLRMI